MLWSCAHPSLILGEVGWPATHPGAKSFMHLGVDLGCGFHWTVLQFWNFSLFPNPCKINPGIQTPPLPRIYSLKLIYSPFWHLFTTGNLHHLPIAFHDLQTAVLIILWSSGVKHFCSLIGLLTLTFLLLSLLSNSPSAVWFPEILTWPHLSNPT